jgi:hypothetical protein
MRTGQATPGEIAEACGIALGMVRTWRQRADLETRDARITRVRNLMLRKPKLVPVIDDPDAAPW